MSIRVHRRSSAAIILLACYLQAQPAALESARRLKQPAPLRSLSACDTEGGKMVRGEGVQSFSRAFLAAGARSTVTTLWHVADAPTADFMRLFYSRLAQGETKAAALRAAKLSFLRSGNQLAQPQYWAAFVLTGDGRVPIPRVFSWLSIAAATILVGGLIFLYRHRRRSIFHPPASRQRQVR